MFDFSARVIGPWESGAGQLYENPVSTPFIKQKKYFFKKNIINEETIASNQETNKKKKVAAINLTTHLTIR